jgi:flagellar biosynthesis protein FlhG
MRRPALRLAPGKGRNVRVVGGAETPSPSGEHPVQWHRPRTRTLVVASGKGGVGKSTLAANLALALGERGARVVLVDGDLAQANLDLLLGVHPRWDLGHVLAGERTLEEIVIPAGPNVRLVPAASGAPDLAELDDFRRESLLRTLGMLDAEADFLLVDTASGVSRQTVEFCRAAHDVFVVCTPEMPAFSDAYALIKLLQQRGLAHPPQLIVNFAAGADEAEETANRIRLVARRFLRAEIGCLGVVPEDAHVPRSVRLQEPALTAFPKSPAAAAYRQLAARLWKPRTPRTADEVDSSQSQRLEA